MDFAHLSRQDRFAISQQLVNVAESLLQSMRRFVKN